MEFESDIKTRYELLSRACGYALGFNADMSDDYVTLLDSIEAPLLMSEARHQVREQLREEYE